MIHILLLVLKIIGILLLILLGLVLLILACLLFVPLRYRAQVKYYDSLFARGRVSWLLHLVSVRLVYDASGASVHVVVRLFGILLYDSAKPPKEKREKKEKKKDTAVPKDTAAFEKSATSESVKETRCEETKEALTEASVPDKKASDVHTKEETGKNLLSGFLKLFQSITNFFKKILRGREKIAAKLSAIRDKKDQVLAILFDEKNRPAFMRLRQTLFKILRHMCPTRMKGKLYFGFEDPASTGYALGVMSMFYGLFGESFVLCPDFEHKILKGEAMVAGRLRLSVFVFSALRIITDKNIRRIIRSFKNI